jgi:FKBP-type peptidyl-prolyl cis-trans isomerase
MRARHQIAIAMSLALLSLNGCGEDREPGAEEWEDIDPPADEEESEPDQSQISVPEEPEEPEEPRGIPAPPDVSEPPADATRTASGLATKVLQAGTGAVHPGPHDGVRVHYTGWRAEDGQMFDSSVQRGEPITFGVDGVIAGWTEGLQLMVVGEKRRLWIPGNLAYDGRRGPQGMLVFDVELLEIFAVPETPSDVSAPPRTAQRTDSGLASRVLERGTGTVHPTATDRVEVHYSGWRAEDGEMFDSSRSRGEPIQFALNRVIPGWTEGLQLMVEGEQRRLWIPANLAYEGRNGPQGMLVFDVHLLRINPPPQQRH